MRNKNIVQQLTSSFIALTFFISNVAGAQPGESVSGTSEGLHATRPLDNITVPSDLGIIQDLYLSHSHPESPFVILIQDAHAIPEAQIKIQKLIGYFQTTYGVKRVALEGAASRLDPQIFKSFPDKKHLKKILDNYYENGELTGSIAAAILNDTDSTYDGIEDWHLYEEGLGFYLKAMEKEGELSDKLRTASRGLRVQKERMYSKELLATDQALQSFRQNEQDLLETLKALARIKAPEKGSELALLLEESINVGQDQEAIKTEVKKLAEEILKVSDTVSDTALLNQKYQAYRTSEISTAEFALFLKERWTDSGILPVPFSPRLLRLIETQKTLHELEGTKLYQDFEQYAQSVKESLIRNNAERNLDQESRRLYLLDKMAKLELSREEWKELKNGDLRQETRDMGLASDDGWANHIAFYQNAEKRERAFFNNLNELMTQEKRGQAQNQNNVPVPLFTPNASLLVAGGFHTEGLTEQFKKTGVSYAVVRPRMSQIPERNFYREHMRGEVSWKHYFRVENGKVNLYEAFVRGTRDRLLRETLSVESKTGIEDASRDTLHQSRLLKTWRDQIIRDLAGKKQIAKAHKYIRFLDEVPSDRQSLLSGSQAQWVGLKSEWYTNIDRFIEGIRRLDSDGRLTQENIRSLLKPSNILGAPAGNVVLAPQRSEIRRNLLPGFSPRLDERNSLSESRSETRYAREVMEKVSQWFRENPKFDKPGLDLMALIFAAIADLKRNTVGTMEGEPTAFHVDPLTSFETLRVISTIEAMIAGVLGFDAMQTLPEDLPERLDQLEEELDQWAALTSIAGTESGKFLSDAQTDWKNRIFALGAKRKAWYGEYSDSPPIKNPINHRIQMRKKRKPAKSEMRTPEPSPAAGQKARAIVVARRTFMEPLFSDDETHLVRQRGALLQSIYPRLSFEAKKKLLYPTFLLVFMGIKPAYIRTENQRGQVEPDMELLEQELEPIPDLKDSLRLVFQGDLVYDPVLVMRQMISNQSFLREMGLFTRNEEPMLTSAEKNYAEQKWNELTQTVDRLIDALVEKAGSSAERRDVLYGVFTGYPEKEIKTVVKDLRGLPIMARTVRTQYKGVGIFAELDSQANISDEANRYLVRMKDVLAYAYASIRDQEDFKTLASDLQLPDDVLTEDVPSIWAGRSELRSFQPDPDMVNAMIETLTSLGSFDGYLSRDGRFYLSARLVDGKVLSIKVERIREGSKTQPARIIEVDLTDLRDFEKNIDGFLSPVMLPRNVLYHGKDERKEAVLAKVADELAELVAQGKPKNYIAWIFKIEVSRALTQRRLMAVLGESLVYPDPILSSRSKRDLHEGITGYYGEAKVNVKLEGGDRNPPAVEIEVTGDVVDPIEKDLGQAAESILAPHFPQYRVKKIESSYTTVLFTRTYKKVNLRLELWPGLKPGYQSIVDLDDLAELEKSQTSDAAEPLSSEPSGTSYLDLSGRPISGKEFAELIRLNLKEMSEKERKKPVEVPENDSDVIDLGGRAPQAEDEIPIRALRQAVNSLLYLTANEEKANQALEELREKIRVEQPGYTDLILKSVPPQLLQKLNREVVEKKDALLRNVQDNGLKEQYNQAFDLIIVLLSSRSEIRSGTLPLPMHKILEGLREESPASLRAISDDINEAFYRRAAYGEKEQSDIYRQVILRHQMTIEHAVELHNHGLSRDHLLTLLFGIWFAEISELLESSHPLDAFSEYFTHLLQRRNPSGTFTDSEYLQDGKRGIFNAFHDFLATWISTDERVSKETRLLISDRYIQFLKSKHPEEATLYSEMYKRVQVNPEFPRKFKKYLLLLQMGNPYAGANPVKESFEKERLIDFRNALQKGKSNPAFYARALALGEATFSHFYSELDSLISEYGYIHVLNQLQSLLDAGLSPKAYQEVAFKVILKETVIMVENNRDLRYLSNMAYRGKDQRIAIVAAMQILLKSPPKKRAKLNTKNRLEVLNALEKRYEDDQPLLDFFRALKEAEVRGQARSDVRLGLDRHQIVQNLAIALGPEKIRSELRLTVNESELADQASRYIHEAGAQELAEILYQSVEALSRRIRMEFQNESEMTKVIAIRHKNLQEILAVIENMIVREFGLQETRKITGIENGAPLAIALDEYGRIVGLPIAVPPGQLAKSLRELGGTLLKKVVYVTDHTIPDELRTRLGIPTKRVPAGGRIEGFSLIGKARVANRHIFQMEAEVDATEMDPLTADLLIHLMAVTGVMVNYGGKGERIRHAADPIAELLKQYPGLNIILNQESLKFTQRNGSPVFVFAMKTLQERLSRKTLETAA